MVNTAKLSPRIDSEWKECFDRHIDRENSSLGEEVEKAVKHWLATYYLINEDARDALPEKDRELIEKAIAKQTYETEEAYEKLDAKRKQDQLDDILDMVDDEDDLQGIKNAMRETGN